MLTKHNLVKRMNVKVWILSLTFDFTLVTVHRDIWMVMFRPHGINKSSGWMEDASLQWWMLKIAAQVITQASRQSLVRCFAYSSHTQHAIMYHEIFERATTIQQQRAVQIHSMGCFIVTRNPMLQLSGTPGLFTRGLLIKVLQPVIHCHVASAWDRVKVRRPCCS